MKKQIQKSGPFDIIDVILEHHKPLKQLLKILKGDGTYSEKKKAFGVFFQLLSAHAIPEENVLYANMKGSQQLSTDAFEGEIEHHLADQLSKQEKHEEDKDVWVARVKVLSELVEHHLQEEEEDIFPKYKKESSAEQRQILGMEYLVERTKLLKRHHIKTRDENLAISRRQKDTSQVLHS